MDNGDSEFVEAVRKKEMGKPLKIIYLHIMSKSCITMVPSPFYKVCTSYKSIANTILKKFNT